MDKQELISSMVLELRRGIIVLCVLGKLHLPTYGYNLVADLGEDGIKVEANTLYPLLRRLEGQGLLESSWETGGAKPRKYYVITDFGKEIFDALKGYWKETTMSIEQILGGTEDA